MIARYNYHRRTGIPAKNNRRAAWRSDKALMNARTCQEVNCEYLPCLCLARWRGDPDVWGVYDCNHCFASMDIKAVERLHTNAANQSPLTHCICVTEVDGLDWGMAVPFCMAMSYARSSFVTAPESGMMSWRDWMIKVVKTAEKRLVWMDDQIRHLKKLLREKKCLTNKHQEHVGVSIATLSQG